MFSLPVCVRWPWPPLSTPLRPAPCPGPEIAPIHNRVHTYVECRWGICDIILMLGRQHRQRRPSRTWLWGAPRPLGSLPPMAWACPCGAEEGGELERYFFSTYFHAAKRLRKTIWKSTWKFHASCVRTVPESIIDLQTIEKLKLVILLGAYL